MGSSKWIPKGMKEQDEFWYSAQTKPLPYNFSPGMLSLAVGTIFNVTLQACYLSYEGLSLRATLRIKHNVPSYVMTGLYTSPEISGMRAGVVGKCLLYSGEHQLVLN